MSMKAVYVAEPAEGGLPKLKLAAADGARAEVYLYGAHVVSWRPAGAGGHEADRLFLSRKSAFRLGAPIRGGIPIVFPQFGASGPLPLHGLVRLLPWELVSAVAVDAGAAGDAGPGSVARFRVSDTPATRAQWDHGFEAELAVQVGGNALSVTLGVFNAGVTPFGFTTSFHTYLTVNTLAETTVEGLAGLQYRDAAAGGLEVQETAPAIGFTGEVNRIYFDAPAEARLVEKDRTTIIRKAGFADTVVWNPGAAKCATMTDLEPDDYLDFVCVEAAAVRTPIHLGPGQRWQGSQTLVAL